MKKEKKKLSLKAVFKTNIWLFKKIWEMTPSYVVWMVLEGVIWGFHHSIGILYVEKLFDALDAGVFEDTAAVTVAFAVYQLFFWMFHCWYWVYYNPRIREKLYIALHSEMFMQAVRLDIEKYDDPEFYNDFIFAMDQSFSHATGLMEDTGKLINRIVASVTLTGVLFSVDALMSVIIFLLAGIRIALSFAYNKVGLASAEEQNPLNRKSGYIGRVFRLPDYAKELRTSRVKECVFDDYERNTEQKKATLVKYGKKYTVLNIFSQLSDIAINGGLIIVMLYKVMVTKSVALGGFAVAINASWKMAWTLDDMVQRIMRYHEHGIFIEKMQRFMETQPTIVDGEHEAEDFCKLEIKNVSFSYTADTEKRVLDNVSMEINRGEKIAIVGYNGAGKTTLTKLIMRLYDPSEGEILYNGKPLSDYTVPSLRRHTAAVFQDSRIFAASLGENVVGGEFSEDQRASVEDALRRSAFHDKLVSLEAALDTHLTREFRNDGTQLSGGESQKVAIARAFYKNADLIILDEPSSALDPDAEYELNRQITEYAEGRAIIFISHRLSTTRHADRIYMFDGGRLIESGTHDELMSLDGKYAYMFALQAKKYKQ